MEWLRAGLTVLFGAIAGGVTNRIAVWMLFHPYEPPSIRGRTLAWLQGAVPKNQKRLAASIGRVVGGTLLTPADLAAELNDEELRLAFREKLSELLAQWVANEQPAVAEVLPEAAVAEVRKVLRLLLEEGRQRLVEAVEAPEFGDEAREFLDHLRDALSDDPIAEALGPEGLASIREGLDGWIDRLTGTAAFENTVRRHLNDASRHVLQPGRTLEELIPAGLVATIEHAIQDYLPIAMERLGRLLDDPDARERVERLLHELLDRFMRDLRLHQRLVAKLIITEDTIHKVLRTLEAEGTERLAELLREQEVQRAMAKNVNDAIVEFLRRPAITVLGEADSEQVQSALDSVAVWIVNGARDPESRAFLLEQLEGALGRLGDNTWAEALRLVPPDRIGPWIASALRSEPGSALFERVSDALVDGVLERPIGRLSRFVPEESARGWANSIAPGAWSWISQQVPEIADRIEIAGRVERKIEEFPLRKLEELVRDISQKELDLIVRLGYILGAIIGLILVGVNSLF